MLVPSEESGWSDAPAVRDEEALTGAILHHLFLEPWRWIHRRVESVEILDDESIHRRVTLDFTIDSGEQGVRGLTFTPLTFLRKEVLTNFDLRDQEGQPVPILTKRENGRIAGNALIVLAETIIETEISDAMSRKLRFVAIEDPELAIAEFESWSHPRPSKLDPDADHWRRLLREEAFVDFASELSGSFILLAAIKPEPGKRKLVKFGYEERFSHDADDADWKQLFVRLGWSRCGVEIEVPSISFSESFHLEVKAPVDLEIDAGQIRFEPASQAAGPPPRGPTTAGRSSRAHLYASQVSSEFRGLAVLFLRRRRDSFLWSAFLTALLVSLLLFGGRFRLDHLLGAHNANQNQTAAALLLIVPTLLAAYVARSGEHMLDAKVLLGVRALVIGAATCAIVGVVVLSAGFSPCTAKVVWSADLGVSLLITAGLLLSLVLPRPTREP